MILITGASGFIGTRLAARLSRDRREPLTALVHRLGTVGAARLATLRGVHLVAGDVRDASSVDEAMRGCEVVVHCALDPLSAPSVQEEVTTLGTRIVSEAARRHGVRHLVFLSTAAVHSWTAPGRYDEDAPTGARDLYTRTKLEAESVLLSNTDVPVTIIRPTCVYGPFSRTFTVGPVEMLRLGIPLVPVDNAGRANLIYVDNLVDLIVGALDRRPSAHRIYLANDEEPTAWETLYGAYARTIGLPLERYSPAGSRWQLFREEISVSLSNGTLLLVGLTSDAKGLLLRGLAACHRHVPVVQRCDRFVPRGMLSRASAAARRRQRRPVGQGPSTRQEGIRPFAPRALREFYNAKATFSAERAKRELGWTPRIGAAEAIDRTCEWIRFAGL